MVMNMVKIRITPMVEPIPQFCVVKKCCSIAVPSVITRFPPIKRVSMKRLKLGIKTDWTPLLTPFIDKGKLDVACDKDKGEIGKEQLLRTDSDEFQELVNRPILTKNPDKGISLEEQINPCRQDYQHEPELTVLETGQKEGCRIADKQGHKGHNSCIEYRVETHFEIGQVL